jgi:hypothetical protein
LTTLLVHGPSNTVWFSAPAWHWRFPEPRHKREAGWECRQWAGRKPGKGRRRRSRWPRWTWQPGRHERPRSAFGARWRVRRPAFGRIRAVRYGTARRRDGQDPTENQIKWRRTEWPRIVAVFGRMGPEHGEQPRWNRPSLQRRWAIYRRIGPTSQHFGPTSQHFRATIRRIGPTSGPSDARRECRIKSTGGPVGISPSAGRKDGLRSATAGRQVGRRSATAGRRSASSLRRRTAWTARTDRAERTDRTEQSGLTDQAEQAGWTQ